jgi:hypothetical protein
MISNIYGSTKMASVLEIIVERLNGIQNLTDGHEAACTARNRSIPSACSIV